MRKGDRWFINAKTGELTSTYYNRRYRVNARASSGEWRNEPTEDVVSSETI